VISTVHCCASTRRLFWSLKAVEYAVIPLHAWHCYER
jgi:hypothetical protein